MNIESELKRITEGLKMTDADSIANLRSSPPRDTDFLPLRSAPSNFGNQHQHASVKPTGSTVLEALENLQTHAGKMLAEAAALEIALIGNTGTAKAESFASDVPDDAGLWDRLAAKIVLIERVFAQIDAAHNATLASLK